MKVQDVMQKQVDFVSTSTPVRDVSRLIFGRGINGVPVLKNKKVVGFITERDILSAFLPTVEEYIEDPVHNADFEKMEGKISEVFNAPASKIMNKKVTTVTSDTPLLKAESLMLVKKVGRLPVVDKEGKLIGIIAKSDIFRTLVGDKLGLEEDEKYKDWLSKHHPFTLNWKKRLSLEIPDLVKLMRKEGAKKILDIGCGTGDHAIELAKLGFTVYGFERSKLMLEDAMEKREKLSEQTRERVKFFSGEYEKTLSKIKKGEFQAAIFMGGALAYNPHSYRGIIRKTANILSKEAVMVFQIPNFEKALKENDRLFDFSFFNELPQSKTLQYPSESSSAYSSSKQALGYSTQNKDKTMGVGEHAFLEFYDPPANHQTTILKTFAIFDFDGKMWNFYGLRNTLMAYITDEKMKALLKKNGFSDIEFYGSEHNPQKWDRLFKNDFEVSKSDWMNIVARR